MTVGYTMRNCPSCAGTGQNSGGWRECARCIGSGDDPARSLPARFRAIIPGDLEVLIGSMPGPGGTGYAWLAFAAIPSPEIRNDLKTARFRWNPREQRWEGPCCNLPARYTPDPVTLTTQETRA